MAKFDAVNEKMDALVTEVSSTRGAIASGIVALDGLGALIRENAGDPAALAVIAERIESAHGNLSAGRSELAEGIARNPIPGEVVPPPEPPVA